MKSGCIHLTNYRATLHNKPPSVCYLFHPGEAVIDYFAAGTLKHLLHSIMRKSILGNSLIEGWGKAVVRPVRRVWLNNDHRRHDIITTMAETVKPRKYDAKEVYKEHNMQKLVSYSLLALFICCLCCSCDKMAKETLTAQERSLGKFLPGIIIESLTASPDNDHLAYKVRGDNTQSSVMLNRNYSVPNTVQKSFYRAQSFTQLSVERLERNK